MTILVFGQSGQVARELQKHADVISLPRTAADLRNPDHCAELIAQSSASFIINAAAYTAVDNAENDYHDAMTVNGSAPAAMAAAAAENGIPFIQISTDYVFDGKGDSPHRPSDPANPVGVYGLSKLKGEEGVRDAGGCHVILRTSWVFSQFGNNFVKTMLRLSEDRSQLSVVNDQIGGPTPAADIAATCLSIGKQLAQGQKNSGTYHYSGTPGCSWADFAREIFRQANRDIKVHDIPTSEYPTPAERPLNSLLDCSDLENDYDIKQPDWRAGLKKILTEIGAVE
ncbi:dTDP-4-dehydrorhamnose reductase [Parasphingorhabdus sp.]|uniref:dTDP-4-dehydrorhamnose reductase n=1 Tax=Parasphingorhabdus sp. TaxID=2709688 RepID=UPI003A8FAD7B